MTYREKTVGIIGLGYVGLPLAYLSASKQYNVIGVDVDEKKVYNFNNKLKIPKQLKDIPKKDLKTRGYNNYDKLIEADIIVVCVPTPTKGNNEPDLSLLEDSIINLAPNLKRGALIIIESTIGPGMTKEYVAEKLYSINHLEVDKDYKLSYCPERIDPGNKNLWVGNINRICGSSSEEGLKETVEFYSSVLDAKIIEMNSIEEAELVKVWENSYRNLKIAASNLLAVICDKYNFSVNTILDGLKSKVEQFGMNYLYPGLGPGGHCIPEDIHFLIKSVEKDCNVDMSFFKESAYINDDMVYYALDKLKTKLNNLKINNPRILMLGISYKPNSDDLRCSKAMKLYDILKAQKYNVTVYDYIIDNKEDTFEDDMEFYLKSADVVILSCGHEKYLTYMYENHKSIKCFFDCWNLLYKKYKNNNLFEYFGIGE